jgi:hypothetical protein
MYLPEKVVAGTHNTELEFKRRLKTYHDLGDDAHPIKFFDDVDRSVETLSKLLYWPLLLHIRKKTIEHMHVQIRLAIGLVQVFN